MWRTTTKSKGIHTGTVGGTSNTELWADQQKDGDNVLVYIPSILSRPKK